MKRLVKLSLIMSIIIMLYGCSKMDTVKLAAYHTVEQYCSISDMGRVALREQVSEAVAPNSIKVNCSGD